ncbi:MAG: hypothetical protein ACHQYQ_10695 [Bacteriovoracales bacterium]
MKKTKDEKWVRVSDDFLPPPEVLLASTGPGKKITLAVDPETIDRFKKFTKTKKRSYQKLMRLVLWQYANEKFPG